MRFVFERVYEKMGGKIVYEVIVVQLRLDVHDTS